MPKMTNRGLLVSFAYQAALLLLLPVKSVSLSTAPPGPVPSPVSPCDAAHLADLRFMVGSWAVEVFEPGDPAGVRHGVSTVSPILDGCALQETLRLTDGYEEVRILAFDGRAAVWQMATADTGHGNLLLLTGHRDGDGLRFITTHPRATALLVDRVSMTRTGNGWTYLVEAAAGYGQPWEVVLQVRYTRRVDEGVPPAGAHHQLVYQREQRAVSERRPRP